MLSNPMYWLASHLAILRRESVVFATSNAFRMRKIMLLQTTYSSLTKFANRLLEPYVPLRVKEPFEKE